MGKDPYRYFRVEARDLAGRLASGLLELEKNAADTSAVEGLMRAAHTLKGAARVVKQNAIAEQAHAFEDLLARSRDRGGPASREEIEELLRLVDAISAGLESLGAAPAAVPASAGVPFDTLRVDVEEMDALLSEVSETEVQMSSLRRTVESIERCRRIAEALSEQVQRQPRARARERLLSMTDELFESLRRAHGELAAGLNRAHADLRQVRHRAHRARLVPASAVFGALERAARDAARTVGRQVIFETAGGDVRVDGHVLSAVREALLHVVRNAVDHGIEDAAERARAGKAPAGRVALSVQRRGNRIGFVVTDDGRGIDADSVRRAAIDAGIVPVNEAAGLSEADATRLILRSGVSTRRDVTEVSGRGVGLDVLRDTVARLGGDVIIRTQAGRGAAFEIRVPVSLSSMTALLVEAGGIVASLPLDAVSRAIGVASSQIAFSPHGDTIVVEETAVPICSLESLLLKRAATDGGDGLSADRARMAVLVRGDGGVAALRVDRLAGTFELAARPLPGAVRADPVVSGASLDAEGNPVLQLDPECVVRAARSSGGAGRPATPTPGPSVLVIDDSLTTRMLEQSILESAGYRVDLAVSGEEALRKARARRYHLFVVDIEMPGMNGFEFLSHARSDPALSGVPSIMLTSRASMEDRRRSEELGARAFIVKSEFDQGALLRTIRSLVA